MDYLNYFAVARLEAMAAARRPGAAILTQGSSASGLFVQSKVPAFAEDLLDIQSCIARVRGARMTWQRERFRSGASSATCPDAAVRPA